MEARQGSHGKDWPAVDQSPADGSAWIGEEEVFLRLTLNERLQHLALIVCVTLLVLSGLPMWLTPSAWLGDLFFFERSFAWRGLIHRMAGVGLIVLSIFHVIYISGTKRGRTNFRALWLKPRDILDALQSFGYNLGLTHWLQRKGVLSKFWDRHPFWLFRDPPRFGRYNFIEKIEYWSVGWGTVIMVVTGFFLWATNLSLRLFPLWVYDVFKVIHSYEAILALLAILIWHLYNVHFRPEVFPMSKVWIDGRITGRELRLMHPLEYQETLEKRKNSTP